MNLLKLLRHAINVRMYLVISSFKWENRYDQQIGVSYFCNSKSSGLIMNFNTAWALKAMPVPSTLVICSVEFGTRIRLLVELIGHNITQLPFCRRYVCSCTWETLCCFLLVIHPSAMLFLICTLTFNQYARNELDSSLLCARQFVA